MTQSQIYLSPPDVCATDRNALLDAFDSNWISTVGPHLTAFEQAMADRLGVQHAVALSSGTAAIHLALQAVGVQPNDDVLCSTLTFCASANPITYLGARPVFIDSEPDSWNLDPNLVEEEIHAANQRGKRPAAIVAVDIFGQCANFAAIRQIANRYEIPVIEDAAEALGASFQGQPAGSLGDVGILSFNGNKMISTSGGGMLCTNDKSLAKTARHLATQAREAVPHYQHEQVGYNYRMSNLLAALGNSQLQTLDEKVARRRAIFAAYQSRLTSLPGIHWMPEASFGTCNRWLSVMQLDPQHAPVNPTQLREWLAANAIESRPVWKPLHLQPSFAQCRYRGGSVAEELFMNGLCLPSGSGMTDEELDRVISSIGNCIGDNYHALAA